MINKLPRWVWVGGSVLAFVGGMVNVVGLLSFDHQAVSHLTATTSRLSVAIADRDAATLPVVGWIIGSFFAGAFTSGWLIRSSALQLGRRYSTALCLESALLCIAIPFLQHNSMMGIYFCAGACGLQNAMASTYSGAIVRTTHMTGVFTDLGMLCGQRCGGLTIDKRRLLLCVLIIGGFCTGGAAAAMLFPHLLYFTLLVPALLTAGAAVAYLVYRAHREHDLAENRVQAHAMSAQKEQPTA